MESFDVIILGAGGAGMMCAIQAGKRGRKTALVDHASKVGAKILISGGSRCNFTNLGASPANYVSQNPHFCVSALSRYKPEHFIQMVKEHSIPFHEKKLGQLFCDHSARDIVEMLTEECRLAGVEFLLERRVSALQKNGKFTLSTDQGPLACESLVIATGGLSIPKVGATDFGYRIARQFGLQIVEPSPALDGFRFTEGDFQKFGDLAGVSADAIVTCGETPFRENVLFTHAGLIGPAALQASLYWRPGDPVQVNFIPGTSLKNLSEWFLRAKSS